MNRRKFVGVVCTLPLFKYFDLREVAPSISSAFAVSSTNIPSGTFTSPNFTIPNTVSVITTQFTIDPLDAADPTKTFTFELWREASLGVFTLDHGFTWQGGLIDPKTGLPFQPSMTVEVGPLAGVKCQIRATLSKSLTAAIAVTAF